jgi:Ku protein
MEYVVAPRAYWKGYLKLSLVSCPVALFPASSEREKISFNQINKKTGNRIRYRKVDAETGDEVGPSEIIKGYEVGKGQYIEIKPAELEAIAIATAQPCVFHVGELAHRKLSLHQVVHADRRSARPGDGGRRS